MNSFNYREKTVFYNTLNNMLPLIEDNGKILLSVDNGTYIVISKNYIIDKFLIYIKSNKKQKQIYLTTNDDILKTLHTELAHKTVNTIDIINF